MSNVARRIDILPPWTKSDNWYLRRYLIRYDENELIDSITLEKYIKSFLATIDESQLIEEIDYYRVGFIICHYGRRGICISVWHWGRWITTSEMFCQHWYTFGRDYLQFELLDHREPVYCHHEVPIILSEAACFIKIAPYCKEYCDKALFAKHSPIL